MNEYSEIEVETFIPISRSGVHGEIHVRPIEGQDPFLSNMFVQCSKELVDKYPVGFKFRIKAKITTRMEGEKFICCS